MRLILAILLASPAFGAIAFVNAVAADDASVSGPSVATAATSHTTGNFLFVITRVADACATTAITVTDTASNTYTKIGSDLEAAGIECIRAYYAKNITGNASNIVTLASTPDRTYKALSVIQFSGVDTTNPLDASATGTAVAGSVTSGTFTTTTADQVIIAGMSISSYSNTVTAGAIAGTTADLPTDSKSFYVMSAIEYRIVSGTQTNATAAFSNVPDRILGIFVATFKAAGAATSSPRRRIIS